MRKRKLTSIISRHDVRKTCFKEGMTTFLQSDQIFTDSNTILLIIDVIFPVGYPWSIKRESFHQILQVLSQNEKNTIYVLPVLHPAYNVPHVLENIGLLQILEHFGAELLNPWTSLSPEQETDSTSAQLNESTDPINFLPSALAIPKFDMVISYTQLRLLNENSLWTTTALLYQLYQFYEFYLHEITITQDLTTFQDPFQCMWHWFELLFADAATISERNQYMTANLPDSTDEVQFLFINDGFEMVNQDALLECNRAKIQTPKRILFGANPIEVDRVTYTEMNLEIQNAWYFKLHPSLFTENDPPIYVPENDDSPPPSEIVAVESLHKSHSSLRVHQGILNEREELLSLITIPYIRSITAIDLADIGLIDLLIGKNPPSPTNHQTIILFGDNAIETTRDSDFIIIDKNAIEQEPFEIMGFELGGNKVLDEDDLEREIQRKQRKIRQKIEKVEQKLDAFKLDLVEKTNEKEKELLILKQKRKSQLKIQKLRTKIELARINITAKNEKRKIKQSEPNLIINQNIIRIPTKFCIGLDFMTHLIYFYKKPLIPTLRFFQQKMRLYYQFEEISKKGIEAELSQISDQLQASIKELSTPLLPEIKKNLLKVEQERKDAKTRIMQQDSEVKTKIRAEFDPKIKKLEAHLRTLKREDIKNRIHHLSKKIKEMFTKKQNTDGPQLQTTTSAENEHPTEDPNSTDAPSTPIDVNEGGLTE